MASIDKIKHLIAKYPQVVPCFENKDFMSVLKSIQIKDKDVIVTQDKNLWRYYLLIHVMKDPKVSVKEVNAYQVLEAAMGKDEDTPSLSSIRSDILVIHDGEFRSMTHAQKEVMLNILFENSPVVIYEWLGSYESFESRSKLPEEYRPQKVVKTKSVSVEDSLF